MATFDEFINSIYEKGNDGKAFELFCKHFLETSPDYADQFEKVWLWDKWEKNWGRDKGVDLIAKYKGRNKFCAIQAKCYAAHNQVSYEDVAKFLADSNRVEIEDRILMMSTDRLSEDTSRETIEGQEKPVVIRDRNYFENIPYDFPKNISEIKKAKPRVKKAKPRDHQRKAIDDVVNGFSSNDRGQLIMACGTGKTFTTLWIKERLKCNNTLVLLPSLSLLSQTMREWVWGANDKFEALAVCSDPTVGRTNEEAENDISAVEVGKVSWQVDEIKLFLSKPNSKVVFCTYQSSKLIMEAQIDKKVPSFDLIVCDEAHRCAGSGVKDAAFSTVLFDDKIRAKKRLFTTATPRYFGKTSRRSAAERGVELFSMDDEEDFGPQFHKLSFGEAIEINMLTDYQVVVVGLNEPMVNEWISDREIFIDKGGQKTDAKSLASKIAILKSIKDYNLKRLISFHNTVNKAKGFSLEVEEVNGLIDEKDRPEGRIWARHVDGTMVAGKRRQIIKQLKDLEGFDIGLLTNAKCLSEGVDVPSLDGVAFVEPRSSQVDIIQSVGRAIRKSDNKTKGTIVLPVFLADGDDPDTVISATNFKPVWEVLKALKAHDESLDKQLDEFRTSLGSSDGRISDRIDKVIFDLPVEMPPDFASKLTTRLVEAVTSSWWFNFGLLQVYCEENSSALVPSEYKTKSNYSLGGWVDKQRQDYRRGYLSEEQINLLESMPMWYWVKADADWDQAIWALDEYIEEFGKIPSNSYVTPAGIKLGGFLNNRRNDYKAGNLSAEKVKVLENKKGWSWDPLEEEWERNFQNLLKYFEEFGDYIVPQAYMAPDNTNLGSWVGTQMQNYQKGKVKEDRIKRLNGLTGWYWSRKEAAWESSFSILKEYYDEHKKMPPQTFKTEENYSLGNWLINQRNGKDDLSEDQLRRLQELNFEEKLYEDPEKKWLRFYKLLKDFFKENGHSSPKALYKIGEDPLGYWVVDQRQNKAELSSEKKQMLDAVEFDWAPVKNKWDKSFKELKKFVEEHGHADVPADYESSGIELGGWVRRQRDRRRPTTEESKQKLNELNFIWDIKKYKWNYGFSKLEKFYKENGHSDPKDKYKVDGFNIGGWCYRQRNRKEELDTWQIQKLDTIEFNWVPPSER